MATTFTKLGLFNAALLSQGKVEIAEDDDSLEWRTLNANWATLIEAELQDSAINYSLIEEELPTRAADGSFGYDDAYTAPTEALHIRHVWKLDSNGDRVDLDWFNGKTYLHVNDAAVGIWVEYVEASDPGQFGPLFAQGIQMKLEAIILRAMKEEYRSASEMEARAEEKLQRARTNASNEKSPKPLFKSRGRFSSARFTRG
jgi:hypothetical protein